MPNYNYAKYLKGRIKSILKQTYPIYELVILDDKSSDESEIIIEAEIKKIKIRHPEIKVQFVKNEKNSGKAMAQWKKGFELATGDFVWIAEADDLSSRRFLEEAMKGFDNPEVVLSYTESAIINGYGMMLAPNFRWSRDKEKTGHYKNSYIKDGEKEIEEIMAIRCTIPNVSGVVFKNDRKYLKYFDEALRFTQVGDWYFYVKVLENGKISYNRKSLNKFRVHGGSVTNNAKRTKLHYKEIVSMHRYFIKNYNLFDTVKSKIKDEENKIKERLGL